jgi:hypothetical protein
MCNNFLRTNEARTLCYPNDQLNAVPDTEKLAGVVHARYNCADSTIWILTYAFRDRGMANTPDEMKVAFNDTDQNNQNGDKNVKYGGDSSNGYCNVNPTFDCPVDPCVNGVCTVCCWDLWPVLDDGEWVGWIAKAGFNRSGENYAWDTMMVHWNWLEAPNPSGSGEGSTSSSGSRGKIWGICMNCTAFDVPTGKGCLTPIPTPMTDLQYCPEASTAVFNFSVTNTGSDTSYTVTTYAKEDDVDEGKPAEYGCTPTLKGPITTVTCDNLGGAPSGFLLYLNVTNPGTDNNGNPCQGGSQDFRPTHFPAPMVNITAVTKAAFCAVDGRVEFDFIVFSDVDYAPTNWTLTPVVTKSATPLPDCTSTPPKVTLVKENPGEPDEYKVTVTCNRTGGLPIPFTVNLTVTVESSDHCKASASDVSTLTGLGLPLLEIVADTVAPFCALDGSVTVTFNVSTDVNNTEHPWELLAKVQGVDPTLVKCEQKPTAPVEVGTATVDGKDAKKYQVTYVCTGPSPGSPLPTDFSLNLTVTVTNPAGTSCKKTQWAVSHLDGFDQPVLKIVPDSAPEFCALDGTVTGKFNVSTDVEYNTAKWALELLVFNSSGMDASGEVSCKIIAPTAPVGTETISTVTANIYQVGYVCTGLPPGGPLPALFLLQLKVNVTHVPGSKCYKDGLSPFMNLAGFVKPVLLVAPNPPAPFCAPYGHVAVTFNVTTDVPYASTKWTLTPSVTLPGGADASGEVNCSLATNWLSTILDTVSIDGVDATVYQVLLDCNGKPEGGPLPTDFFLTLEVIAAHVAAPTQCSNTTSAKVQLDGYDLPGITIDPLSEKLICTNIDSSTTVHFKVTSDTPPTAPGLWRHIWTVEPPDAAENVTCQVDAGSIKNLTDPAANAKVRYDVPYTCTPNAGKAFPATFSLNITIEATNAGGCMKNASGDVVFKSDCCLRDESTFARGQNDSDPVKFSNATCFLDMPVCYNDKNTNNNNSRWGWRNKLNETGSGTYDIYAGAAHCDLNRGHDVGDLTVGCSQPGGMANVSLTLHQPPGLGIESHFFVGCREITKCNPKNFMQPKEGAAMQNLMAPRSTTEDCFTSESSSVMVAKKRVYTTTVTENRCGGQINLDDGITKYFNMKCACSEVRWVFHQGSDVLFIEHQPDGSCLQV